MGSGKYERSVKFTVRALNGLYTKLKLKEIFFSYISILLAL